MPIYDYQCDKCGHCFELRQGFDAEPVETCPRCRGRASRRFHSVAVIYKGSGFYTTDYAHKNVSVSTGSREEAPSKTKEGSASSSESTAAVSSTSATAAEKGNNSGA